MQVALLSPYVQREVLQQGNGVSQDKPIILPNKVRRLCLAVQVVSPGSFAGGHASCFGISGSRLKAMAEVEHTLQVTLEILELLLTYCRFHRASGRSDKVHNATSPCICSQLRSLLPLNFD